MRFLVSLCILIMAFTLCNCSEKDKCSIDSKIYGTWNPPPELVDFWKGMNDAWWDPSHPDIKELNDYFKVYIKKGDTEKLVSEIIADLKDNWSLLRVGLYSSLLLHCDHEKLKAILEKYRESADLKESQIAINFIADLEEVESGNGERDN